MKLAEIVQLAPAGSVVEQVLAMIVKPAPARVVEVMGSAAVPALVRVKTWAGAVVFAGMVPKATRPLDDRDPETCKFRGDAYLATGLAPLAEKEYRAVLARHEIEPESPGYPLSWLGLGRALVAQGNRSSAINAYQHFFTLWAHADPDAIYLKQVKQEFAALQTLR